MLFSKFDWGSYWDLAVAEAVFESYVVSMSSWSVENNEKKCSAGSEIGPRASLTKSTTCMKLSWKIGASPNAALYFKESFYYKLRSMWLYYKSYIILAYAHIKNLNLRSLKGVRAKFKLLIHFIYRQPASPPLPPKSNWDPRGCRLLFPHKILVPLLPLACPGYNSLIEFCQGILLIEKSENPLTQQELAPLSRITPRTTQSLVSDPIRNNQMFKEFSDNVLFYIQ
jgi:hypothetical protein